MPHLPEDVDEVATSNPDGDETMIINMGPQHPSTSHQRVTIGGSIAPQDVTSSQGRGR
jgi:NADH:ubiquinone oxidoreductase subunit D